MISLKYIIIIGLIPYLISFFIIKKFANKHRWEYFLILGWFLLQSISSLDLYFIHENFGMDGITQFSDFEIYIVYSFKILFLEPIHHILFLVALGSLTIKHFKRLND